MASCAYIVEVLKSLVFYRPSTNLRWQDTFLTLNVADINIFFITDINDFLTNSGWFSYIGKPHGKEALNFVLAKKSGIEYEPFMKIKKAIYMLTFLGDEKVYIGMLNGISLAYTFSSVFFR